MKIWKSQKLENQKKTGISKRVWGVIDCWIFELFPESIKGCWTSNLWLFVAVLYWKLFLLLCLAKSWAPNSSYCFSFKVRDSFLPFVCCGQVSFLTEWYKPLIYLNENNANLFILCVVSNLPNWLIFTMLPLVWLLYWNVVELQFKFTALVMSEKWF